jgi:hypothetical protein
MKRPLADTLLAGVWTLHLAHQPCYANIHRIFAISQGGNNPLLFTCRAILAHFEFTFQARDPDFKANDSMSLCSFFTSSSRKAFGIYMDFYYLV